MERNFLLGNRELPVSEPNGTQHYQSINQSISQSINQSINQSNRFYTAPYVINESFGLVYGKLVIVGPSKFHVVEIDL